MEEEIRQSPLPEGNSTSGNEEKSPSPGSGGDPGEKGTSPDGEILKDPARQDAEAPETPKGSSGEVGSESETSGASLDSRETLPGEEDDFLEEEEEEPDPEMAAMLESSFEVPTEGSVVTGTILAITQDDVMVGIGGKSEGIVPLSEFDKDREVEPLAVGQNYELVYKGVRSGQPVLSRREARQRIGEIKVLDAYEKGEPVSTHVIRRTKGGLRIEAEGLPGFLPFSHTGIRRGQEEEIEALIGQTFPALVVEAPTGKDKDLVVSRRLWLEKEAEAARKATLERLRVGDTVKGTVKHLTHFGAFVDLGGVDGLLHVKDMSWGHVSQPEDIVQLGQEVETVVLSIDGEKIALGLKQKTEDPWERIEQKYPAGTDMRYKGKVTSLTPYGAFVMLEPGVEGLIHISEMSWTKRLKHPSEILKEGDEVEVVVLSIDKEKRRVALGYKQTMEDPWEALARDHPEGSTLTGTVVSLTSYGAFVSLGEGIDGMIHVSDLTWGKKISHPSQVVKVGDVVETKILKIDRENRKISLGMKQVRPDPWEEVSSKYPEGTVVEATVNNLTEFGAFAEIEPGLDGLIHISEISSDRVDKPGDVLEVGQKVKAVVKKIDLENRRIGLSMKAVEEMEAVKELERIGSDDETGNEGEGLEPLSEFGRLLNEALEKGKAESDSE